MIKAPFNFVPLSDKVYFPDWADKISHDVPFEDGLSGTIELKITAQTPIFVRNGHTKEDAEAKNDKYKSFSKSPDGRYFIPATSIKGAIRSVMEIMSFGKMRLDNNMQFAQREWDNKELFSIKDPKEQAKMRCGFLVSKGDEYEIIDCEHPFRIAHTRIDEYIGSNLLKSKFCQKSDFDITKETEFHEKKYDPKSAVYKYALVGDVRLSNLAFVKDEKYAAKFKENRVKVSQRGGDFRGTIVFTGQPDKWMFPRPKKMTKSAGKFYDFVFPNPKNNAKRYVISEEEFNHYKFIYRDSTDWNFAKERLHTTGVPVFFRLVNGCVKDWGLAFLYKLPYSKTPFDTLSEKHRVEEWDLADCIFGTVSSNALKGRVMFTHAFSENATDYGKVNLTLGSPKASYYPIYVKQNGRNGIVQNYDTYNSCTISGWKRYVVRKEVFESNTNNDNIDSELIPVNAGSVFLSKIVFHNLKKIELGALLSALSFHNTTQCFHQIGQGKPYGFGKVSISLSDFSMGMINTKEFLISFEEEMYEFLGSSWVNCERMRNLITISKNEVANDDMFRYMVMSNESSNNEFIRSKKAREYLKSYEELIGHSYQATSLYEGKMDELRLIREERLKQEEKNRKEKEERRIQEQKEKEVADLQKRREERQSAGLSFLLEKRVDKDELKIVDFAKGVKRVEDFMRKNQGYIISEVDTRNFKSWMSIIVSMKNKDMKSMESNSWKLVSSWFGQDLAQQWFDEIVKG